MSTNEELAGELVKDADALLRVVHQYGGHPLDSHIREAARRLTLSAKLRTVEDMRAACLSEALRLADIKGEWTSNPTFRQCAQTLYEMIARIPLPVETQ